MGVITVQTHLERLCEVIKGMSQDKIQPLPVYVDSLVARVISSKQEAGKKWDKEFSILIDDYSVAVRLYVFVVSEVCGIDLTD